MRIKVRKMVDALREAETFIADELEVRKASYLPDSTKDEARDIADAEGVLESVRMALSGLATVAFVAPICWFLLRLPQ